MRHRLASSVVAALLCAMALAQAPAPRLVEVLADKDSRYKIAGQSAP